MSSDQHAWKTNFTIYGARKKWHHLKREGCSVARCTVECLRRQLGFQGVTRSKKRRIAVASDKDICPLDLVCRQFHADKPNRLWVADFTYVATSNGFIYVAFIIDVFSSMIVGWRVARSILSELIEDAREQALWARKVKGSLISHSDRGSQYLAIRYSDRLLEAGIDASIGSVGDGYDNAMAETINGLFKAEVIHRCGLRRNLDAVEYATLQWVDWFNNHRLLEPIVRFLKLCFVNQISPKKASRIPHQVVGSFC